MGKKNVCLVLSCSREGRGWQTPETREPALNDMLRRLAFVWETVVGAGKMVTAQRISVREEGLAMET